MRTAAGEQIVGRLQQLLLLLVGVMVTAAWMAGQRMRRSVRQGEAVAVAAVLKVYFQTVVQPAVKTAASEERERRNKEPWVTSVTHVVGRRVVMYPQ
jgi:hypothetical protein